MQMTYLKKKVKKITTVEPRSNKPLYNEVLGKTNNILFTQVIVKQYNCEREPRYNETSL